MKYIKHFMIALLLISLFFNIYSLWKVNDLEENIQTVLNQQSNIMNHMNDQTYAFSSILDDFKAEQSWISPILMEVEEQSSGENETMLRFEWQIKELAKNSLISFHYKFGDTQEYLSIPTKEVDDGLFEVRFPFELQLEPEWYIHQSKSDSSGNIEERSHQDVEVNKEEKLKQSVISYYVTVTSNDLLKSSEIHTEDLGYIGYNHFGLINSNVHIDGSNHYISIDADMLESKIRLEKVYVYVYNDDKLVNEYQLEENDQANDPKSPHILFEANFKEKNEYTHFKIKLIYSDGSSFEKEV